MSYVKRWFEEHVYRMSDEYLKQLGYSEEQIELLRDCFPKLEKKGESSYDG